jgi:ATP/maltotriose-dependent transcriptional regulator MalT
MLNIPSARLTVPRAVAGEIVRKNLIDTVLNSPAKLVYIHAGAGHGKTTLLSQVANSTENVVWLSLDGENDIFTFINTLCEAVKQTFPEFDFSASEYLPFSEKNNFISMLAGALICSIENISGDFIAVMDDLHTIEEDEVKRLITCLIKYLPNNAKLCFGSREAPPQDFLSFKVKGNIAELTQKELAFTRDEIACILGFDDPAIYGSTEGGLWPSVLSRYCWRTNIHWRHYFLRQRNFVCLPFP